MKPTVYVQLDPRRPHNALNEAIKLVATSNGGQTVNQLIDQQETEANIAVVYSLETAQRALKETEKTVVFITCLPSERDEVEAFVARSPARIKAWPIVERRGEENVMRQFIDTIANSTKAGAS